MDDERRHKVTRINIFTVYTYQIINFFEKHRGLTLLLAFMLSASGLISAAYLDIIIVGPFLFKAGADQQNLIFLNLLFNSLLLAFLYTSSYFSDLTFDRKTELLHGYLISIQPSFLLVVGLALFYLINPFTIPVTLWIIFNLVLQFVFLLLNVSLLIIHKKASADRSIVITVSVLYLLMILLSRLL